MVTEVRLVHRPNVLLLMASNELEIVTDSMTEHRQNAHSPRVVTELGMVTDFRLAHQ